MQIQYKDGRKLISWIFGHVCLTLDEYSANTYCGFQHKGENKLISWSFGHVHFRVLKNIVDHLEELLVVTVLHNARRLDLRNFNYEMRTKRCTELMPVDALILFLLQC